MENLNLNFTILIQLANFLVTVVVLNYLLIKPIRNQLHKRKTFMNGYVNDVQHFTSLAEEKLSSYQKSLDSAKVEASTLRDTLKSDGLATEQSIISLAQADAQRYLKESKESIAVEMHAAKELLEKEIPSFTEKAISKILS